MQCNGLAVCILLLTALFSLQDRPLASVVTLESPCFTGPCITQFELGHGAADKTVLAILHHLLLHHSTLLLDTLPM